MNTLHLCHWQNLSHLKKNLTFFSTNDSLVIFGEMTEQDKKDVNQLMQDMTIDWYLVKTVNDPNIPKSDINHEINHPKWLELILQHNNTYAWK